MTNHNKHLLTHAYSEEPLTKTSDNSLDDVADSEAIRLPTLKELIGYPTIYYDDRFTTTSSSILLHLLRNDVDNDISRQNVEESLRGTDESQDSEKEITQSSRGVIEEIGDSWLQQASEDKAISRTPRLENITNFDERVSVTNAIQESENKQKISTTSIYLKPTTMRGIPLTSLIANPVTRGFYITKSENDLSSSILANSSTPYMMTDIPVEQQTEIKVISDISTTDETVTVIHNDRIELEPDVLDNVNDIISDKSIDSHEEKYSTPSSTVIFSKDSNNAENFLNREESNLITIPIDKSTSKREKLLRNFNHTTPFSNSHVVSSTTPTRRRIALVVSRYNEATTPLWTGRRIVAKKRNRTVSPIKDAIRRAENNSIRDVTNTLKDASLIAKPTSTLISRSRKLSTTSIIPTIHSTMSDYSASSEILNFHNNLANSGDTKIKDLESHITVEAMTSANSIITTSSISKIIPTTNDLTTVDISTFSDDSTTMKISADANVSTTITSSTVAVSKAPVIITEATTAITPAITSIGVETTSLNYSVTDNPTIENTNVILTDSAATMAFATSTKTEITSTNVNIIPEIEETIVTDSVTESTVTNNEVETTFTMSNYPTITITDTINAQEITTDNASITTAQITNSDVDVTSTIVNYSALTIPTTINMHDIITDAISTTTASTEVETTSVVENYSTFTTVKNTTTIPVTATIPDTTATLPLTTVIFSTVNTQQIHATTPMIASNDADASTVTANITTTTPLGVIIPTINDLNAIATSANTNFFSTPAINETLPTTFQSRTSSITSEAPIASTVVSLTTSAAPTTLTTEFSTIHVANNLDISNNSEVLATITTSESIQTTEIPTTFKIPSIFTSPATTIPKPLHNMNFEASVTAALSTQEDKSLFTPKITQTPTIQVTTNTYSDADSVQTISGESTMLERKTDFKEAMSTETNQTEDQIIMTINKPSFARTMSMKSTTPEMKIVSEETTLKTTENRNLTTSELDTTNYQYSQKTARRRVLNRTNNWLGSSAILQRTNQYPRHRVVSYRGRPRRPPTHISSSKAINRNHRRRITQKKIRVNSEAFNSTVKIPDQDTIDVQNTTQDHVASDRARNVRRMKIISKNIKEIIKEEITTVLPTEETTVFLQSSIQNEMLHHQIENIEEKQEIILKKIKHSQENFTMEETNSSSSNESLPDNSQSNLHVTEDLSELEKSRKMEIVLKNVRSQSEEKNPIEEMNANSDSININIQDNFPKNSYTDKNLSNKRITERRMRVVLKSIRPKSEEKNSTIENINTKSTDKNLQNNLSNNTNQDFSNEKKIKRRMRVVLKRIKSKSEEDETNTEEATEYDSNESLQGTFSSNFYSAKNLPIEYGTRKRTRVVLKSIKPKSEGKNSTVEETTVSPDSVSGNLENTFSNNFRSGKNLPVEFGTRRRMRVVLKRVKPKLEEKNSTVEKTTVSPDSISGNLEDTFSTNSHSDKNFPIEYRTRKRIKVILERVKPKLEEKNSTVEKMTVSPDSTNENLEDTFLNNFHSDKNLPVKFETRRRMRVVLKNVKPKSEEKNSTMEETSVNSDSTDKDLQGNFSSSLHVNKKLSDEEVRRRMEVSKSIKLKPKEEDSVAEGTSADSNFARKDPQVLYSYYFLNNLHVGNNLPDKRKKHSKSEEKEAMTERPEDTEPQTTRTSVPVEEDTDRSSLEVTKNRTVNRNSENGLSNRRRKPTPFTTIAPLTNTLSNTHRRGRPVETTLSSRIDFVDAFENTESYVKPAAVLHDQNADVSDQSIRAQEFAVTLSDPPSSSSDIGRTPLKDADRRKISTTITPRTSPTTSRTVSRYDANFRSRQRPRTKDRPTVNTTTRPRKPPIIDYDYYEDETPIIIDKSVLNSKLFLTSKGTIRCLDQGNFPHPYSCKKFITCARMVNGQVIGTEYTCPNKLSFDPIGGICNWSAGLGCKD